ncbi:MAG TPA: hypothetical protein VM264_06185 [Acidimicrobiales bacterium]|jgi:hypothetical protein|nr:hypothetical protein [Acidimicrobiales bacterium]
MLRSSVERRLARATSRLQAARAELAVLDEQVAALAGDADDARVRALVSDSPLDGQEHRQAARAADRMAVSRAALVAELAQLERTIDDLLDRLAPSR